MTSALARRALLATAAAAIIGTPACAQRTVPVSGGGALPSFAPLVRAVMPAVVNITVVERVGAPVAPARAPRPGPQRQARGQGSGFIIDASGLIVTNNHVVRNARSVAVGLPDGTEYPARLVGADELTDLALLKIEPSRSLPVARWGDSRAMEPGDWAIVAGNPFGLGATVTAGIISARGRNIGSGPYDDFLQIDASINPGNSGGPVFNQQGEVIGVSTAIVSPSGGSVGIGFAVPSEIAQRIIGELRNSGSIERGWLGVSVRDGTTPQGVLVEAVEPGSPAARAGLRAGDVVMSFNGERVETSNGLVRSVAAIRPGQSARISFIRQGRSRDVAVEVGRRPAPRG